MLLNLFRYTCIALVSSVNIIILLSLSLSLSLSLPPLLLFISIGLLVYNVFPVSSTVIVITYIHPCVYILHCYCAQKLFIIMKNTSGIFSLRLIFLVATQCVV